MSDVKNGRDTSADMKETECWVCEEQTLCSRLLCGAWMCEYDRFQHTDVTGCDWMECRGESPRCLWVEFRGKTSSRAKHCEPLVLSPENLRALRKQAGLTQAGLAEKLGVSERTIRNWESGAMKPRNNRLIHRLVVLLAPERIRAPSMAFDTIRFGFDILRGPWVLAAWAKDGTPSVLMVVGERE